MIPYSRPKRSDLYTLSWSKLLKNHTLYSGTYLYSPYMAVPPPRGRVCKCRELGELGGGMGVGPAENASSFFAAFCDSQKTLEKMAQPSHPCLKPSLHISQISFLSFPSSRLACLALARAPNPVWQPDDTACLLAGAFVINVYLQKGPFAAIFVSWMKVGSVNQFYILFY